MTHELEVRPARLVLELESVRLGALVLRTVGHRARCSCGWRSSFWTYPGQAGAAGRLHELVVH